MSKNEAVISLEERVMGMLAGVAIGDALGMPTEFLTPTHITAWYGKVDALTAPNPNHPHHRLPAGAVTDDTDHTLIVARLLIEQGCISPVEFAKRLLEWSETPRVRENHFVGPSTLKSLAALKAGTPIEQVTRSGTTVGAAMRMAPLAIVFTDRDKLIEQVVASCSVSHFTRNAISGAMAMAFALSESLRPESDLYTVARAAQEGAVMGRDYGDWSWSLPIEERIAYMLEWTGKYPRQETLARLYALIGVDLYPEQLVPCALGVAILADGDPQQAMSLAANLGGDTDTLASMTGSICGGLAGIRNFDDRLLVQVEEVNQLNLRATASELLRLRV
jgi:ADP-ribosylglycohydrolase